MIRKF